VNTGLAGLSLCIQNCNSLNVTSVKNQDIKVSAIVNYGTDIILLSDTRMNGKDKILSEKFRLRYKMYVNSSRNSRGVAVLINNNIHHEVLETVRDPQENYLLLRLVIREVELIIGAVYGPNLDAGCEVFYEGLQNQILTWPGLPVIIGGDWNATYSDLDVNENPDILFMRSVPSRLRSGMINDLCGALAVSDPFRIMNPDLREYTYNPSGTLRKNRSRIDFFLITDNWYEQVDNCTIAQGYCRKTFDHKPVFLNFKKKKGKGRAIVCHISLQLILYG
jgi:exonuclease III